MNISKCPIISWLSDQAQTIDSENGKIIEAIQEAKSHQVFEKYLLDDSLSKSCVFQNKEMLAWASASFAFLIEQHCAAYSIASRSDTLSKAILNKMSHGDMLTGISFSHLRQKRPLVKAMKTEAGFLINGSASWFSGYNIFDHLILATRDDKNRVLFFLLNLNSEAITPSDPLDLVAMKYTNTVSLTIKELLVSEDTLILTADPNWIDVVDSGITIHPFLCIGLAQSAIHLIAQVSKNKPSCEAKKTIHYFQEQLNQLKCQLYGAVEHINAENFNINKLRADIIHLLGKVTQLALVASTGKGCLLSSPAQRIYRESMVLSVLGQNSGLARQIFDNANKVF